MIACNPTPPVRLVAVTDGDDNTGLWILCPLNSSRLANLGTDAGVGKNWRISEPKESSKLLFRELGTN